MIKSFLTNWIFAPNMLCAVCRIVSRLQPKNSTVESHERRTQRLFVLANGPSLKKDIETYRNEILASDTMVVNFMANTEIYEQLRPNHYLLVDPAYFTEPALMPEKLGSMVLQLQNAIVTKTQWPMKLIVPYSVRNTEFVKKVTSSPLISALYLNYSVDFPLRSKDFQGLLHCRYSPPMQNVINTALFLGIVWKYPKVVLLGADTSFHAMVHVEQDTNLLYTSDDHFYGSEQKRYMFCDHPANKKPQTLGNFFEHVQRAFAWYTLLRKVSDYNGVRIVNASSFSWIDAFERPNSCPVSE